MTAAQLFNLVAPIAIYHGADVWYERKARRAINRLMKLAAVEPEIQRRFGVRARCNDWKDYREHVEPESLPNIFDLYKDLFRGIVEDERPEWSEFVDRWGASAFRGMKPPNFSLSASRCTKKRRPHETIQRLAVLGPSLFPGQEPAPGSQPTVQSRRAILLAWR